MILVNVARVRANIHGCHFIGRPGPGQWAIRAIESPHAEWDVEIRDVFIAPVEEARALRAATLFDRGGTWWNRMWRAVARFALRRAMRAGQMRPLDVAVPAPVRHAGIEVERGGADAGARDRAN